MAGIWGWFGVANKEKNSPRNAILALREQLELLQKRKAHLQRQMDEQHALARQNVSSNKAGESLMRSIATQATRYWVANSIIRQLRRRPWSVKRCTKATASKLNEISRPSSSR
jgi:hypothetical protein